MSYIAANGQEITEAMIGSWCDAYERGEFPEASAPSARLSWVVPLCRPKRPRP